MNQSNFDDNVSGEGGIGIEQEEQMMYSEGSNGLVTYVYIDESGDGAQYVMMEDGTAMLATPSNVQAGESMGEDGSNIHHLNSAQNTIQFIDPATQTLLNPIQNNGQFILDSSQTMDQSQTHQYLMNSDGSIQYVLVGETDGENNFLGDGVEGYNTTNYVGDGTDTYNTNNEDDNNDSHPQFVLDPSAIQEGSFKVGNVVYQLKSDQNNSLNFDQQQLLAQSQQQILTTHQLYDGTSQQFLQVHQQQQQSSLDISQPNFESNQTTFVSNPISFEPNQSFSEQNQILLDKNKQIGSNQILFESNQQNSESLNDVKSSLISVVDNNGMSENIHFESEKVSSVPIKSISSISQINADNFLETDNNVLNKVIMHVGNSEENNYNTLSKNISNLEKDFSLSTAKQIMLVTDGVAGQHLVTIEKDGLNQISQLDQSQLDNLNKPKQSEIVIASSSNNIQDSLNLLQASLEDNESSINSVSFTISNQRKTDLNNKDNISTKSTPSAKLSQNNQQVNKPGGIISIPFSSTITGNKNITTLINTNSIIAHVKEINDQSRQQEKKLQMSQQLAVTQKVGQNQRLTENESIGKVKKKMGRPRKDQTSQRSNDDDMGEKKKTPKLHAFSQKLAKWGLLKDVSEEDEEIMDMDDDDDDDMLLDEESENSILNTFTNKKKLGQVNSSSTLKNKLASGGIKIPPGSVIISNRLNKSLMCKPIMMTKATSCNPIRIGKLTQTEFGEPDEKKIYLPVPIPLITPTPVFLKSVPLPYLVPIPMPIVLPFYVPMNKQDIQLALTKLKDLHDSLPLDQKEGEEKELGLPLDQQSSELRTTYEKLTEILIGINGELDEEILAEKQQEQNTSDVELDADNNISGVNLKENLKKIDDLIQEEMEKEEIINPKSIKTILVNGESDFSKDIESNFKKDLFKVDVMDKIEGTNKSANIGNLLENMEAYENFGTNKDLANIKNCKRKGNQDKNKELTNKSIKQPLYEKSQNFNTAQIQNTEEKNSKIIRDHVKTEQGIKYRLGFNQHALNPVKPLPIRRVPINDSNMRLKYSYGLNAWKQWITWKNEQLEKEFSDGNKSDEQSFYENFQPNIRDGKIKSKKIKKEENLESKVNGCDIEYPIVTRRKSLNGEVLRYGPAQLSHFLSLFVTQVTKPNGEPYACDTVYYFCLGIQYYLHVNGRMDEIFNDDIYRLFIEALNTRLMDFQIRLNINGLILCRITEEHLWECIQLGANSPNILLNTLIYFNTKYFMLTTPEAHLELSFSNVMKQWRKNNTLPNSMQDNMNGARSARTVFLRYNSAPLLMPASGDFKKKIADVLLSYEQVENSENPFRCPVKLYEFYLSKCPETIKHRNDIFYLQPEPCCCPDSPVWYSTTPMQSQQLGVIINRVRLVREVQECHLNQKPSNPTYYGN